jgi:hypothetical protein
MGPFTVVDETKRLPHSLPTYERAKTMKLLFTFLFVSLTSIAALVPQDIPLQIVNTSLAARIESAQLTVDRERRVFSYSQVIQNTSPKGILNISLELKTANVVEGHDVNSNVHVEKLETRIAPNVSSNVCVAVDAEMPAFLNDVKAGTVSIIRVQFDDGSVWERSEK